MANKRYIPQEHKEELELAEKEAWSIGAKNKPQNPEYIGDIITELDTFHYYKDRTGRFYYESERVLKLQQVFRESQLKRHPTARQQIKKWYPGSVRTLTKK